MQSRGGSGFKLAWFRAQPANTEPPPARSKPFSAKFFWLDRDLRALAVKDLRMFWRDTTQWGQSVMLFGLLGIYIINLRNFTHQLTSPFWVNLVAYLNLAACSLNLATVTTRFVFPQFSLEGQRLWIVGMAPMGLARVVKTKYWLASALSLAVTLTLITLSCCLLQMTWGRVAVFGAVVTVMTFTLNGVAVGLGVLYPNLKEANPEQNRQRLRRHAVPRVEFGLYPGVHRAAGLRHGGLALARELDGRKRRRLRAALVRDRLAADEIRIATAEKLRGVNAVWTSYRSTIYEAQLSQTARNSYTRKS